MEPNEVAAPAHCNLCDEDVPLEHFVSHMVRNHGFDAQEIIDAPIIDQTGQSDLVPYDSRLDNMIHIRRVQQLLLPVQRDLARRAMWHDYSKLVSPEREGWDEIVPKLAGLTYGSEEYRAALRDNPVIAEHQQRNDHHPEFYEREGCRGMSLIALIEMLADWKAAGERHDDDKGLLASIEYNQKRFGFTPELADILRRTALEMGWA